LGGAVFNHRGTLIVINSTFSANAALGGTGDSATIDGIVSGGGGGLGAGGAIFNLNGDVTLSDSTLDLNVVEGGDALAAGATGGQGLGGAVFNLAFGNKIEDGSASTAILTLRNSILADSSGGVDLFNLALNGNQTNTATADVGGHNIVETSDLSGGTTVGSIFSTANPDLGPLQDNGGLSFTMATAAGSPAINAGNNSDVPAGVTTDQRGPAFPRIVGGTVDIGAFEVRMAADSILVLSPTASGALTLSGNASLDVPLAVQVNSSAADAIKASGNASVTATAINVVGGVQTSGHATLNPTPQTGAVAQPDPFAGLSAPSFSGTGTAVNLSGNQSLTIGPGTYSQITVSGNAKLTLTTPGTYVITTGGFMVSGNASVGMSGSDGVLIYDAGGGIAVSGNAALNLSAETSGPYAGLVIFQARTDTRALNFSGNGVGGLSGTVYAAAAQVIISGNASLQHVSLVCNTLTLSGNAGAFQLADGASSDFVSSTANQILVGALTVAVQDDTGTGIDPVALARLGDAMTYLNTALGSFGVHLTWAAPGTAADVAIHLASSTPHGGASAGVLGFTTAGDDVYLVTTGWDFYTGSDPSGIGTGQYDFQTLAEHELAHTVGLGESSDPASVMYEYLCAGTVRRTFTDSNLSLINTDADRFMKVGLAVPQAQGETAGQYSSPTVFDNNLAALAGVLSEWKPTAAAFDQRVGNVQVALTGDVVFDGSYAAGHYLSAGTSKANTPQAADDLDWFWETHAQNHPKARPTDFLN
jgi:hypothetical protein